MPTNKHTILVALFYNLNFFIYNFVNSLFRYNEYMYMQELMAEQLDSICTTFPTQIMTIFSIPLLRNTPQEISIVSSSNSSIFSVILTIFYISGIQLNFGFRIWITQYLEVLRGSQLQNHGQSPPNLNYM